MKTIVTFRTDEKLKNEASSLFELFGLNLSTAINIFLKQAVLKKAFPCSIDYEISKDNRVSYPKDFIKLFGSGKNLGLDEEPKETLLKYGTKKI